jgi:hypothetical protein
MSLPFPLLESFDELNKLVPHDEPDADESDESEDKEEPRVPYDPERFELNSVSPEELTPDIVQGLADLIDGKYTPEEIDFDLTPEIESGISTPDSIASSQTVIYVVDSKTGEPVGVALILDPTLPDFDGEIPADEYEMLTGHNLSGKMQQHHFNVRPDYNNMGISGAIRGAIQELSDDTFVISEESNERMTNGLRKNGYAPISRFIAPGLVGKQIMWEIDA